MPVAFDALRDHVDALKHLLLGRDTLIEQLDVTRPP
jgi:hypothetical protein